MNRSEEMGEDQLKNVHRDDDDDLTGLFSDHFCCLPTRN